VFAAQGNEYVQGRLILLPANIPFQSLMQDSAGEVRKRCRDNRKKRVAGVGNLLFHTGEYALLHEEI
jgi:hypothetical protein